MQHEALIGQAIEPVDHLLCVLGAERRGADRLRFATREQRRAMGARQEADNRFDRADLRRGAAIDPGAVLEDGATHDFRFQLLDDLAGCHLRLAIFVGISLLGLGADGVQRVRTLRLVGQLVSGKNILADQLLELGLDRGGIRDRDCPRLLGSLFGKADDRRDHLAAFGVGEHDGAQHLFLGQLLGFRFNHHHGRVGARHHEVEATGGDFRERGVEAVFAILEANARRRDRAHERQTADREGSRGGDHRQHIGLALAIIAQHLGDDVDFVVETFGEQRAHRAIDQAGNQRFLFRRAAFALEEATGDTAGC